MIDAIKEPVLASLMLVVRDANAALVENKAIATPLCPPPIRFSELILAGKQWDFVEEEHVVSCAFCTKVLASMGSAMSDALAANLPDGLEVEECQFPITDQRLDDYWNGKLDVPDNRRILRHIAGCDYCLVRHAIAGLQHAAKEVA